MSGLKQAAHVGHPIAHTSNQGGWLGMGLGILIGGAAILLTAGAATPFVIATAVGVGAAAGGVGADIGDAIDKRQVLEGAIVDGARSVFLSARVERAAMADKRTRVSCHTPKFVCRGSKTVFIENKNASRRRDKTSCGGTIARGDRHILVGGESVALPGYEHVDEDRGWMHRWRGRVLTVVGVVASAPALVGGSVTWWLLSGGLSAYGSTDLPGAAWVGRVMSALGIRGGFKAVRPGGRS